MKESQKEFEQIYDQNIDRIYRFIFLKVNSKEVAEDLTAETFTRAWKVFEKKYKGKEYPFEPKSFCYKTARNIVIDYYRKKGLRQIVSTDSVSLPGKEDLESQMAVNSDMEMVMKAIKSIKGDYQDIIIWRYLDELSISEISQLVNKSEGTTRVMVHRAMESLKKVLEA